MEELIIIGVISFFALFFYLSSDDSPISNKSIKILLTLFFIAIIIIGIIVLLVIAGNNSTKNTGDTYDYCKFSGCTSKATTIDGFCNYHQKHLREVNELHDLLESQR